MVLSIFIYCLLPIVILLLDLVPGFVYNKASLWRVHRVYSGKNKFKGFFYVKFHNWNFILRFVYSIIVILLLSAFCGFRSTSVGADTKAYYNFYNTVSSYSFDQILRDNFTFERGFVVLSYLFSSMNIPYYFFSFIIYLFYFTTLVMVIQLYSKFPSLTLSLYICFGFFALNLSTIRQTIAFSFCLLSLISFRLIKNKYLRFVSVLIVPLGALFHNSTILFVLVYCFYFIRIKSFKGLIALILSFFALFLFFAPLSSFVFLANANPTHVYSFYPPSLVLNSFSGTTALLMIVLILYFIQVVFDFRVPLSFNFNFLKKANASFFDKCLLLEGNNRKDCEQIALSMTMFQFLFFAFDQILFLLSRAGLYGSLGICLLIPNILHKYSSGKLHIFVIFGVVVFAVAYFYITTLSSNYLSIMPYGVF